jgi:phage terminase small subunit
MHIRKIQKELEDLNKVDVEQDKIIETHAFYSRDLALAIKDIQDYLIEQQNLETRKKYVSPLGGPMGEA